MLLTKWLTVGAVVLSMTLVGGVAYSIWHPQEEAAPQLNLALKVQSASDEKELHRQVGYRKIANPQTPLDSNIDKRRQIELERKREVWRTLADAANRRVHIQLKDFIIGKETCEFCVEAIRDRLEIKLDLAEHNNEKISEATREALETAKQLELIAEKRYKDQEKKLKLPVDAKAEEKYTSKSVAELELVLAQQARKDYELRFLRLEKESAAESGKPK